MTKEKNYFYDGLYAYNNKDYEKAINCFNEIIDKFSHSIGNATLSETYYMRGICYAQEYSIDEALEDFNEAEKLGFDKSKIYCGRGIAYAHDGKNGEAVSNFTKAIELNGSYEEAYCRRGIAYTFMAKSDEAIADFNKSIELKSNYEKLYYYRGIAFCQKKKYNKALKDFDIIIKSDSDFKLIRINRTFAYYHCHKGHKGKDDNKTTNINSLNNINIMYFIIRTFLEEKITIKDIIDFLFFYKEQIVEKEDYFKSIIGNYFTAKDEKTENEFYKLWIYQYILLDLLSIKNYQSIEELSHYTSKDIFQKLLNYYEEKNASCNPQENHKAFLRLTSISKANDPKEGEILKNLLSINTEKNIDIKEQNKDYLVFQTSFIRYTNSLTMFRLYGKEEEKEGTGICLVFNRSFFDQYSLKSPAQVINNKKNNSKKEKSKLQLYFMLYYDNKNNELIYNPTDSIYKNEVINLKNLFDEDIEYDKNNINITNNIKFMLKNIFIIIRDLKNEELELAYKLLINIRYLIKHSSFFEEQELRLIQLTKNDSNDVSFDKNINRLYSDYKVSIFEENYLKKIIIGPKVENASSVKEVYQYLITKNKINKNIDIEISDLPLN